MLLIGKLKDNLLGVYPGWWVSGLGTGVNFLAQGSQGGGAMGLFFVALERQFGWSRTMISGAFSLVRIEGSLLGPVEGYLIDRLEPYRTIFMGMILVGVGFFIFSQTTHLAHFYIARAVMTLGAGLGGVSASLAAVNWWFSVRRNQAMGITMAGGELGSLTSPIIALGMATIGWRATAFIIGVLMIAIGVPISRGFRRPKQSNNTSTGSDQPHLENLIPSPIDGPEFTIKQALQTRAFWIISIVSAACGLTTTAFYVHSIPHFTDVGLSEFTSATVFTVYGLSGAATRLLAGSIGDRIDKRFAIWVYCSLQAIGLALLAFTRSLPMAVITAIIGGIGHGGRGPVLFSIRGEYFGRRRFGTLNGLGSLFTSVSSVSAPILLGWIFDTQGTYFYGFLGIAATTFSGGFLILLAGRPTLAPSR